MSTPPPHFCSSSSLFFCFSSISLVFDCFSIMIRRSRNMCRLYIHTRFFRYLRFSDIFSYTFPTCFSDVLYNLGVFIDATLEQNAQGVSIRSIDSFSRATFDNDRHWTPLDLQAGSIVWITKRLRGYLCVGYVVVREHPGCTLGFPIVQFAS